MPPKPPPASVGVGWVTCGDGAAGSASGVSTGFGFCGGLCFGFTGFPEDAGFDGVAAGAAPLSRSTAGT